MKGKRIAVLFLLSVFAGYVGGIDTRPISVKVGGYFGYDEFQRQQMWVQVTTLQSGSATLKDWRARFNDSVDMPWDRLKATHSPDIHYETGFGYMTSQDSYPFAIGNTLKIDFYEPPPTKGIVARTSPLITISGRISSQVQVLTPARGSVITLRTTPSNITISWRVTGDALPLSLILWDGPMPGMGSVLDIRSLSGDSYTFSSVLLKPDKKYLIYVMQTVNNFGRITGPVTPDSNFIYEAFFYTYFSTVKGI